MENAPERLQGLDEALEHLTEVVNLPEDEITTAAVLEALTGVLMPTVYAVRDLLAEAGQAG